MEYIRINEIEDVASSVRLISRLTTSIDENPHDWKWIIIASHNALQGAIVCAISGTAQIGALTKNHQAAWLKYLEGSCLKTCLKAPKKEKLADFKELLKRAQKPKVMEDSPLILDNPAKCKLDKLNKLRCDFAHFTPKGWSIEAAGLPSIIITSIETTKFLMEHPNVHYQINQTTQQHLKEDIAQIILNLNLLLCQS